MLTRYWIPSARGLGLGVSAFSREDAERLLAEAGYFVDHDYHWSAVVEDVDVRALDPDHVVPNMGPPSVRGVWYPFLNR